jgi:hypothetical protein
LQEFQSFLEILQVGIKKEVQIDLVIIGVKEEKNYIVVVVNGTKEEIKVVHVALESKHEVVKIFLKKPNLNFITKLVQKYNLEYSKYIYNCWVHQSIVLHVKLDPSTSHKFPSLPT